MSLRAPIVLRPYECQSKSTLCMRFIMTETGLFSPISYSLRTTVISVSRSFCAMKEFTMASACQPSAHFMLSSDAVKETK